MSHSVGEQGGSYNDDLVNTVGELGISFLAGAYKVIGVILSKGIVVVVRVIVSVGVEN